MANIAIRTQSPDSNTRAFYVKLEETALNLLESRLFNHPDVTIVQIQGRDTEASILVTIRDMRLDKAREFWLEVFVMVAAAAGWKPGTDSVSVRR